MKIALIVLAFGILAGTFLTTRWLVELDKRVTRLENATVPVEQASERPCIPGEDECEGCYYCDGEATDGEIAAHIARVREATT